MMGAGVPGGGFWGARECYRELAARKLARGEVSGARGGFWGAVPARFLVCGALIA